MEERQILERINALAREEHALFELESGGRATEDDIKRLRQIQRMLGRFRSALRHWRASREFAVGPRALGNAKADGKAKRLTRD
jgi:hypothetical protein